MRHDALGKKVWSNHIMLFYSPFERDMSVCHYDHRVPILDSGRVSQTNLRLTRGLERVTRVSVRTIEQLWKFKIAPCCLIN